MTRLSYTACVLLVMLCWFDTSGQRRSAIKIRTRSPEWYVGPEIMKVIHTFRLSSDVPELANQPISQTGLMLGGMAGNRIARVHVRRGALESNSRAAERITTTTGGGAITFFPFQVVSRRLRFVEPYAMMGISKAKYDFFGNYVPLKPLPSPPLPNPDCICPCCPGQSLPADPDAVARERVDKPSEPSEQLPEGTHLGNIITRNFNAGFGIETHIQAKRMFIHIFAEGNYLIGSRISVNNVAFARTSIVDPLEFRVGVSAGISK